MREKEMNKDRMPKRLVDPLEIKNKTKYGKYMIYYSLVILTMKKPQMKQKFPNTLCRMPYRLL